MILNSISHIVCELQKDWMENKKKCKIGDGPLNWRLQKPNTRVENSPVWKTAPLYKDKQAWYETKKKKDVILHSHELRWRMSTYSLTLTSFGIFLFLYVHDSNISSCVPWKVFWVLTTAYLVRCINVKLYLCVGYHQFKWSSRSILYVHLFKKILISYIS